MKFTPKDISDSEHNISVKTDGTSQLKELGKIILICLFWLVVIYWAIGLILDLLIVPNISYAAERKMFASSKFSEIFKQDPKLISIANKLKVNLPPKYKDLEVQVYKDDDSDVNAFATVGGNIVFYQGLLDKLKTEEEIAFVMAHEMGHVADRDVLQSMGRSLLMTIILSSLGLDGTVNELFNGVANLQALDYSRQQEIDADSFAVNLLYRTYGHANSASSALKALDTTILDTNTILKYGSTHPRQQERLDNIVKLINEHKQDSL